MMLGQKITSAHRVALSDGSALGDGKLIWAAYTESDHAKTWTE